LNRFSDSGNLSFSINLLHGVVVGHVDRAVGAGGDPVDPQRLREAQ
jgi:hypothetical protein